MCSGINTQIHACTCMHALIQTMHIIHQYKHSRHPLQVLQSHDLHSYAIACSWHLTWATEGLIPTQVKNVQTQLLTLGE